VGSVGNDGECDVEVGGKEWRGVKEAWGGGLTGSGGVEVKASRDKGAIVHLLQRYTSAYVQHTFSHAFSIRQYTSAYVSIRQHVS
jgi:hypothetical protein